MSQGNGSSGSLGTTQQVVDFSEARAQKLEEKRKNTERIFFKNLLSVYSVVEGSSLVPIEFIDLSEEGCAFQIAYDPTSPWPKDSNQVPLRVYFTQNTYLELRVNIKNTKSVIENNRRYVRYGCEVDSSTRSFEAYAQFVRFMRSYAEHAHKDLGKSTVFYL